MLLNDKLKPYRLLLASQSPRRRELMTGCGLPYELAEKFDCEETYPNDLPLIGGSEYLSTLKSEAYPVPLLENDILLTDDTVVLAGGEVTGSERQFFIENELQHDGLTKLIVTKDMSERKAKIIELGDAFIAFPGGTGTLEEITEVMSKVSLKHMNAPCILYNLNGYYDDLKALLAKMIDKGLSSKERQEGIYFAENLDEIKRILNEE